MPLTQGQIDAINNLIGGEDTVENEISAIIDARDDIHALLRIHEDLSDNEATTVLANAKSRAVAATSALAVKLG